MRGPRREGGFTLIEIAVAATIGAASLAALLQVFGDGAIRTDRAGNERVALLLAQSALEGAGVDGPLTPGAAWAGTAAGLGWRVEVASYAEAQGGGGRDAAVPDPLLVTVTVRDPGNGRVLARLATLRLPPGTGPEPPEDPRRRRAPR